MKTLTSITMTAAVLAASSLPLAASSICSTDSLKNAGTYKGVAATGPKDTLYPGPNGLQSITLTADGSPSETVEPDTQNTQNLAGSLCPISKKNPVAVDGDGTADLASTSAPEPGSFSMIGLAGLCLAGFSILLKRLRAYLGVARNEV